MRRRLRSTMTAVKQDGERASCGSTHRYRHRYACTSLRPRRSECGHTDPPCAHLVATVHERAGKLRTWHRATSPRMSRRMLRFLLPIVITTSISSSELRCLKGLYSWPGAEPTDRIRHDQKGRLTAR